MRERPSSLHEAWESPDASLHDLKYHHMPGIPHVLSLRMMVASTRKNVFQPSVTAKPRHTIIRVRPHPGEHHSLLFKCFYHVMSKFITSSVTLKPKAFSMLEDPFEGI